MGQQASCPATEPSDSNNQDTETIINSNSKRERPESDDSENELATADLETETEPSSSNRRSTRKRKTGSDSSLDLPEQSSSSTNAPTSRRQSSRNSSSSSTQAQQQPKQTTASRLRSLARLGSSKNARQQAAVQNEDEDMKEREDEEEGVDDDMEVDGTSKAKSKGKGKGKGKESEKSNESGISTQGRSSNQNATYAAESSQSAPQAPTSDGPASSPSFSAARSLSEGLAATLARLAGPRPASRGGASAASANGAASSGPSSGIPEGPLSAIRALGALALGFPIVSGSAGEVGGPLQALLTDIMGPTSLAIPRPTNPFQSQDASTGTTTPPQGGASSNPTEAGSRAGSMPGEGGSGNAAGAGGNGGTAPQRLPGQRGGTSIIVQGALIARTLPSPANPTEPESQESELSEESIPEVTTETSARAARATRRARRSEGAPPPPPTNPSPAPQPYTAAGAIPSNDGAQGGAPQAQAATIEDQAGMLQRLLSVASSATALSLITSDQQSAISNRASQAASRSEGARDVRSAVTDALLGAGAQRPIAGNSRTAGANEQRTPSGSSPTSNDTAALASGLRNSLRGRSSRGEASEQEGSSPTAPEGRAAPGSLDQRWATARSQSNCDEAEDSQGSDDSQDPNMSPSDQAAQNASRMGRMLHDTLRQGFGRMVSGDDASNSSTSNSSNRQRTSTAASSASSTSPQASQLASINETLAAARNGHMERGSVDGSFQRFMYELVQDLGVAVRGVRGTNLDGAAATAANQEGNNSITDPAVSERRDGDLSSGRLSFYRLFRFETAQPTSNTSPPPLIPALIVGVRSMGAAGEGIGAMFGGGGTGSALDDDENDSDEDEEVGQPAFRSTSSTTNQDGISVTQGERRSTSNNNNAAEQPTNRFLLFVAGGTFSETHPLLASSNNVARRDVLALIEILSIFNALGLATGMGGPPKPPTATQKELDQANFKAVLGNDLAEAALRGDIHESTAEKCLICWEEWSDEDRCRALNCKHAFHQDCIYEWLTKSSNSCPCCRRPAVSKPGASAQSSSPVPVM